MAQSEHQLLLMLTFHHQRMDPVDNGGFEQFNSSGMDYYIFNFRHREWPPGIGYIMEIGVNKSCANCKRDIFR